MSKRHNDKEQCKSTPPPPKKKKKNKLQIFGYTLFFMQNIKKIPTRIENNN